MSKLSKETIEDLKLVFEDILEKIADQDIGKDGMLRWQHKNSEVLFGVYIEKHNEKTNE